MDETKIEADQRYKLLSDGERRFLEIPESELSSHYKRPDLAKNQFLMKIRYRAINAIIEIAWLCDKLPKDQLQKIFLDNNCVEELIKTMLEAIECYVSWGQKLSDDQTKASELKEREVQTNRLHSLLEKVDIFLLSEKELYERNKLLKEYKLYFNIRDEIIQQQRKIIGLGNWNAFLQQYLTEKGLMDDFNKWRHKINSTRNDKINKNTIEDLRNEGFAEDKIERIIEVFTKNMKLTEGQ